MKNYQFISHNETDTKNFAKNLSKICKSKDIIVLTGDLGSGKTKLTEGILTYFNLQDEISSPTFTIVNEYDTEKIKIFHFDVYRLADVDEFFAIGGEEYFEKGASIIEWGEMIEDYIPQRYLKLEFSRDNVNENQRLINIENIGNINIKI